jgi:hypothetical protein
MHTGLDVRLAVHEANEVFRRFPARISVLPVLLGLLSYTMSEWMQPDQQPPDGHHALVYLLLIVVGGFVMYWIDCFVQVAVSSMYLRAREGEEPGTKQVGEAWQYRGFVSLAGGLLLRIIGWTQVILVPIAIAIGVISVIVNGIAGSTSGVGATAGGVGHGFAIVAGVIVAVAFVIVATFIFCRYMFIFPMFAIERGSGRGFLDECVRRTKTVLKTAAWVQIVGMIPACLIVGVEMLARRHWTPPLGVHIAIELAVALVNGCYAAWFILVKTGLAMQLMAEPAAAIEPIGDGAAI